MKIIDKIVLNRFLSIITAFVLGVLKLIAPETTDNKKRKRKVFPWRKTDE